MKDLTKNELQVKDKMSLLDELIIQLEALERQVKTKFVFASDVSSKLELDISRLSDRMTWL